MPRALLIPATAPHHLDLARALLGAGHLVRGVVPPGDAAAAGALREAGAELFEGDPDRIATIMPALVGVTAVAWLHGDAASPDLNGGRLRMLCERLVDTPVRGLAYEAAGTAGPDELAVGREIVAAAAETWTIPVEVLDSQDPAAATAALRRLLGDDPS